MSGLRDCLRAALVFESSLVANVAYDTQVALSFYLC